LAKQCFEITTSVHHVKNENVAPLDPMNYDIGPDRQTSEAGTQVVITAASKLRRFGKQQEVVGDGIDQALGNIGTATFRGDVEPNLIKLHLPRQQLGSPSVTRRSLCFKASEPASFHVVRKRLDIQLGFDYASLTAR
jgi:hypothetical protein